MVVVRTQVEIVGEWPGAPFFSRLSGGKVLSRSVIRAAINFRGFCSGGHKSALSEVRLVTLARSPSPGMHTDGGGMCKSKRA